MRNSNYPQFDYDFASGVKENNKEVWGTGGNIRGNEAFNFLDKGTRWRRNARHIDWIKEREAWAARHFEDGAQFKDGDLEPNKSNIGGVVAQMKWGVIGTLGEQGMKDAMLELIKKLEGKKDEDRALSDLPDASQERCAARWRNTMKKLTTQKLKEQHVRTLAIVYERGMGAAAKTNRNIASECFIARAMGLWHALQFFVRFKERKVSGWQT